MGNAYDGTATGKKQDLGPFGPGEFTQLGQKGTCNFKGLDDEGTYANEVSREWGGLKQGPIYSSVTEHGKAGPAPEGPDSLPIEGGASRSSRSGGD